MTFATLLGARFVEPAIYTKGGKAFVTSPGPSHENEVVLLSDVVDVRAFCTASPRQWRHSLQQAKSQNYSLATVAVLYIGDMCSNTGTVDLLHAQVRRLHSSIIESSGLPATNVEHMCSADMTTRLTNVSYFDPADIRTLFTWIKVAMATHHTTVMASNGLINWLYNAFTHLTTLQKPVAKNKPPHDNPWHAKRRTAEA